MIYYISLDNPNPSGGVKTQYRHVKILNRNGYPASMLHEQPGFTAATWFSSPAPIVYANDVTFNRKDVLVWPEILRTSIRHIEGVSHVIFNQNVHYTWRGSLNPGMPVVPIKYDYAHGAIGTMVLTEFEKKWLDTTVPGHSTHVVRHGIDPTIWAYDSREKRRQIAYMPRKHHDEAEAVFGWLAVTGALAGWDVVSIDRNTEIESSEILKSSGVFFAFGYPEGGTLPPFEALAAGCVVIGYGGFASDDLLAEAGGRPVASGDTCRFAAIASILLTNPSMDSAACMARSKKCFDLFPMQGEERQLLQFMREVVGIDG